MLLGMTGARRFCWWRKESDLMGVYFEQYWNSLWRDIPLYVFESLAVVFCIGAVVLLALKGFKGGWRYVSGLLLAEYVFLLYCSTVIKMTIY